MEIPPISRILKLNAKEWPYIVTGIFFSAIAGAMPVLFAIILAEILQVDRLSNTTLFQRSSNIIWTLLTLDGRCFDVLSQLGYN